MHRLAHEIRVAIRGFLRTPAFLIAVLLVLGCGIDMTVATFSVYRAVRIARLPVAEQDGGAVF